MAQHVKQPSATAIADGFVAARKVRGVESKPERHRTCIPKKFSLFVLLQKISPISLQDFVKLLRILCLQKHQCRVVRQGLDNPLVAISTPPNQVAPPLMSGFVRQD